MQYFLEKFNPKEYECLTDLSGNQKVTLMIHTKTQQLIIRKMIDGINIELYKQLVHIRHKNLVQIMGLEKTESGCYTYEEYVNGETLSHILERGPIQEEQALGWIQQLCEAVRTLHEQNPIIIHRDIKPSNIMLTSDGVIKLIDFDAAKEFTKGKQRDTELIGTPDYAAPEQYGFGVSDPRTDIYAIGILFHELITGSKPSESNNQYRGRYKKFIQNCIAFEPKMRYRSVREAERQLGVRGINKLIRNILGFRTGVWWKKVIASVSYIAAILACHIAYVATNITKPFTLIVCFFTVVAPFFILIANPMRLRQRLPLLRSGKISGIIIFLLIWFVVYVIAAMIYAL